MEYEVLDTRLCPYPEGANWFVRRWCDLRTKWLAWRMSKYTWKQLGIVSEIDEDIRRLMVEQEQAWMKEQEERNGG